MRFYSIQAILLAFMVAAIGVGQCWAQDNEETETTDIEGDLLQAWPEGTWLSISGAVASVSANEFKLNHGNGVITVEMDDGDRDADAYKLLEGDEVVVTGYVDDELFEERKLEATSVHVKNINTTFYASGLDDDDRAVLSEVPPVTGETIVRGWVTGIDRIENEFTIDDGLRQITVDVSPLAYDPLDDDGYQKIEEGDYVSVTGRYDEDLFEERKLDASTVMTLVD